MPLDFSIISGLKSPQFDLSRFERPDSSPINTLAGVMKLKQLQQEGDINALTLGERKGLKEFMGTNPDLKSADTRTQLASRFGETGRKVASSLTDIGKAETDEAKRRNELTVSKTAQYKDLLRDVNDQRSALNWIQMQQQDPDLADSPIAKVSIMDAARNIPADPAGFNQWKQQAALGMSKFMELNKPSFQQVNRSGTTEILQTPGMGGTPTTIGTYADVPFSPDVEAQKARIAGAGASRAFTSINTQLPASEEAQKEFMKESRQTFSALKQAPTVLDNIEKAKALVPQSKGFMGAGGESVLQVASFLNNRLGTSIDTKGVTSAEELRSRLFLGIMDNLKKLDSQPSQQQQAALQVALGSIGTDPSALLRVLDVFGDTIRQKVDLYNEEVQGAEKRGVKFPYSPVIRLPAKPESGATPASAPIYASNPKTGQRIMSTDGGNTWTSAR